MAEPNRPLAPLPRRARDGRQPGNLQPRPPLNDALPPIVARADRPQAFQLVPGYSHIPGLEHVQVRVWSDQELVDQPPPTALDFWPRSTAGRTVELLPLGLTLQDADTFERNIKYTATDLFGRNSILSITKRTKAQMARFADPPPADNPDLDAMDPVARRRLDKAQRASKKARFAAANKRSAVVFWVTFLDEIDAQRFMTMLKEDQIRDAPVELCHTLVSIYLPTPAARLNFRSRLGHLTILVAWAPPSAIGTAAGLYALAIAFIKVLFPRNLAPRPPVTYPSRWATAHLPEGNAIVSYVRYTAMHYAYVNLQISMLRHAEGQHLSYILEEWHDEEAGLEALAEYNVQVAPTVIRLLQLFADVIDWPDHRFSRDHPLDVHDLGYWDMQWVRDGWEIQTLEAPGTPMMLALDPIFERLRAFRDLQEIIAVLLRGPRQGVDPAVLAEFDEELDIEEMMDLTRRFPRRPIFNGDCLQGDKIRSLRTRLFEGERRMDRLDAETPDALRRGFL